jgi:hypothetical protein
VPASVPVTATFVAGASPPKLVSGRGGSVAGSTGRGVRASRRFSGSASSPGSTKPAGFSAHVGDRIEPQDKRRLEDTAAYLVRNPLSLEKLVYLDGQQAVLYRSKTNLFLGRNFEALDPLEWLARMSDHIPDPGRHRTIFYGEYSNRIRGAAHRPEPDTTLPPRRRCSPSWPG